MDIRSEKVFESIKGKDWSEAGPALAKSFLHSQRLVGADKIVIPGKDAKPEDVAAFYTKLGRPESFEGYEPKLPDGIKPEQLDAKMLNDWRGEFHKLGLSKSAGEAILQKYLSMESKSMADADAAYKAREEHWIGTLKTELGADYDGQLNLARHAIGKLGTPELTKALNESGLGSHPEVVKLFARLGSKMSDDIARTTPNAPSNPLGSAEQATVALQAFQRDPGKMKALLDKSHPEHDNVVKEREALFAVAYPVAKS